MPRRQYRIDYTCTVAVDDSVIVEAMMDLSGPVQIQDPPEMITAEHRLHADMSFTESLAAGPKDFYLRFLAQRAMDGQLLGLSTAFAALLPGAEFHMVDTTAREEQP